MYVIVDAETDEILTHDLEHPSRRRYKALSLGEAQAMLDGLNDSRYCIMRLELM